MRLTVLLVAAWELLGRLLLDAHDANFVPMPSGVAVELFAVAGSGELWAALWRSALRVAVGGSVGAALGVLAGALGASGRAGAVLRAPLALLRPIPPIAWIPLTLLWFGVSELQQVVILAGATFHVVALGVGDAARRVPEGLVAAARNLGAGVGLTTEVRVRAALPGVLTAVREGFAVAWFVLVAAEFVSAAQGVGVLVLEGRDLLLPARTFVGMGALAAAGALTDWAVRGASGWLVRWT
ncbi:ABC transporter permease [Deltaproteobacteria bacterium]|nr:ABC transporter permease [Deltaproteobacteria bacterium]